MLICLLPKPPIDFFSIKKRSGQKNPSEEVSSWEFNLKKKIRRAFKQNFCLTFKVFLKAKRRKFRNTCKMYS